MYPRMICKVREERMNLNITQEQLARKVSVTRQTIQNIELGICIPNILLAMDIAKELNKEVTDIFKERKGANLLC